MTNKQHTACSLAELDHPFFYIESLGLRSPDAGCGRDWKRLFKRLMRAFLFPKKSEIIFGFGRHWSFQLHLANSRNILINSFFYDVGYRRLYSFRSAVLFTYNPLSLLYVANIFVRFICVDEISAQPGMNKKLIQTQRESFAL